MSTPSLTISFYPKILTATINGRKKENGVSDFILGLADGEFGNYGNGADYTIVVIDKTAD